jgi:predicted  nucleic acid-binding Zn-ribbon protein
MNTPKIDNRITTGNLLSIATVIFAAGSAWALVGAETKAIREHTTQLRTSLAAVEARVERSGVERAAALAAHEARIRALETSSARSDAQIGEIYRIVQRIEQRIERIVP